MFILADMAYDARELRQHNQNKVIRSNIPVNQRNWNYPELKRLINFDLEEYMKCSAVERFLIYQACLP